MANDDLKNLVDTIVDKSKDVAKKAESYASTFISNAKNKIEAEKIEYAINKKYRELGKAYYTAYEKGETFDSKLLLEEIHTLFDALNAIVTSAPSVENEVKVENTSTEPDDITKFFDEKEDQ